MLTQFFVEFMDYTNKFSRSALIGYSLGGLLALKASENAPGSFEFVIALGAPLTISQAEQEKMKYYTTRKFFEKMRWLPNMLEYHEKGWKELLVSVHDMLYIGSDIFINHENTKNLRTSVHLIMGDHDEVANYRIHEELVHSSEYLNLIVLPDTSHFDYFVKSWPVLKNSLKEILDELIT
jgi:pimeloyl-ACP methyl ester carboxylesterase